MRNKPVDVYTYTDEKGQPIPEPEPPPIGASIERKIEYLRARCAWHDRIMGVANTAFAKGFKCS